MSTETITRAITTQVAETNNSKFTPQQLEQLSALVEALINKKMGITPQGTNRYDGYDGRQQQPYMPQQGMMVYTQESMVVVPPTGQPYSNPFMTEQPTGINGQEEYIPIQSSQRPQELSPGERAVQGPTQDNDGLYFGGNAQVGGKDNILSGKTAIGIDPLGAGVHVSMDTPELGRSTTGVGFGAGGNYVGIELENEFRPLLQDAGNAWNGLVNWVGSFFR